MFKKQTRIVQSELWVRTDDLVLPASNPFYEKLNALLDSVDFDEKARNLCKEYYTSSGPGKPGVDPAVYFKMLLIGFFEGIGSERGIEARCADSITLHRFLGYSLTERIPDHSTLSIIRKRLPVDVFDNVFALILPKLHGMELLHGKHIGSDTSVIDANASMRKLKNRLTGKEYRAFVEDLAKQDGVDVTDPAAVARFDRKRKKKVSNDEWVNPHDPDAKIGPTKHGSTRMIYKPEHTVDMETGAIIDAQVQLGDMADSADVAERIIETEKTAAEALGIDELPIETTTNDKGYYCANEIEKLATCGILANIPDRCANRNMDNLGAEQRKHVEESAQFVKSDAGKKLLKKRGMYIERSFAHVLDAGGMRRTTLRGMDNVQKRYSIAALGYNLSLILFTLFGVGTPKQWAAKGFSSLFSLLIQFMRTYWMKLVAQDRFRRIFPWRNDAEWSGASLGCV